MPITKKRFNTNPRIIRTQKSDNRFNRNRIHDESSDMLEAKRARFKNPKTGMNHPERSRVDDCSAPSESREDPPMPVAESGDAKTSEFAYFKRLKQGVGRTSRTISVNRENIQVRNIRSDHNVRGGVEISKEAKAPIFATKSSTRDLGSFFSPQDVARQRSGMHRKVDDDTEMLESLPVIKTPATIHLDNVLSASAAAYSVTEPKGDVFSLKRQKLQQWISKTLFPEADKVPKDCDVVSLLMSRLLPESSSKIPSESETHKESELKDKCPSRLLDSSNDFEECWDGTRKLIETNVDHFLDGGVSPAYRETRPSFQIKEVVDTFGTTCVDTMLLGFKEESDQKSSLDEIDSVHSSDMFHDRNLLTWNNGRSDYSPEYKSSSNTFKNEFNDKFQHGYDSELPAICYDRFSGNCPRRKYLEYEDQRPDCQFDIAGPSIWRPISSGRFKSSAVGSLMNSAEIDEFTDGCHGSCLEYKDAKFDWHPDSFERYRSSAYGNIIDVAELKENEMRGNNSPLLLPWRTDDTNMNALTHLTDIDHEIYPPPSWTEDHHSLDDTRGTSPEIYPSIFPSSSPSLDRCTQRHQLLHHKDTVSRSSYAPLTLLYAPDPPNPDETDLFKDVFRSSRLYVLSENHNNHYLGNVGERVVPATGALLISQGLDSDLGLQSKSISDCIDQQYDILTNGAHQLSRYEKSLEMPLLEESSLINVDIPAHQEVLFPLQVHRIRWLDTAVETNYDDLQIATLDSLL